MFILYLKFQMLAHLHLNLSTYLNKTYFNLFLNDFLFP